MRTCELAERAFNKDLESGNLKCFTFGIGSNELSASYLENEYNLNVWHMGCIVEHPLLCYNELVEQHVSTVRKTDFWAFLDELKKTDNRH